MPLPELDKARVETEYEAQLLTFKEKERGLAATQESARRHAIVKESMRVKGYTDFPDSLVLLIGNLDNYEEELDKTLTFLDRKFGGKNVSKKEYVNALNPVSELIDRRDKTLNEIEVGQTKGIDKINAIFGSEFSDAPLKKNFTGTATITENGEKKEIPVYEYLSRFDNQSKQIKFDIPDGMDEETVRFICMGQMFKLDKDTVDAINGILSLSGSTIPVNASVKRNVNASFIQNTLFLNDERMNMHSSRAAFPIARNKTKDILDRVIAGDENAKKEADFNIAQAFVFFAEGAYGATSIRDDTFIFCATRAGEIEECLKRSGRTLQDIGITDDVMQKYEVISASLEMSVKHAELQKELINRYNDFYRLEKEENDFSKNSELQNKLAEMYARKMYINDVQGFSDSVKTPVEGCEESAIVDEIQDNRELSLPEKLYREDPKAVMAYYMARAKSSREYKEAISSGDPAKMVSELGEFKFPDNTVRKANYDFRTAEQYMTRVINYRKLHNDPLPKAEGLDEYNRALDAVIAKRAELGLDEPQNQTIENARKMEGLYSGMYDAAMKYGQNLFNTGNPDNFAIGVKAQSFGTMFDYQCQAIRNHDLYEETKYRFSRDIKLISYTLGKGKEKINKEEALDMINDAREENIKPIKDEINEDFKAFKNIMDSMKNENPDMQMADFKGAAKRTLAYMIVHESILAKCSKDKFLTKETVSKLMKDPDIVQNFENSAEYGRFFDRLSSDRLNEIAGAEDNGLAATKLCDEFRDFIMQNRQPEKMHEQVKAAAVPENMMPG